MAGRSAADREEEEGGREQDAFKLRIAWQYRRYIKTGQQHGVLGSLGGLTGSGSSASGSGSGSKGGSSGARKPAGLKDWCHQFDLLKVAGEEGLQQCRAELADCSCSSGAEAAEGSSSSSSTQRLVSSAAAFVQSLTPQTAPPQQEQAGSAAAAAAAAAQPAPAAPAPPRGPQHVGRIAVLSLGSLGWQLGSKAAGGTSSSGSSDGSGGGAVLRALLQLKALARDRRCAVAVSVPAALFSASDLARMQHIADGVIALESVADDSDIVRWVRSLDAAAGGTCVMRHACSASEHCCSIARYCTAGRAV
jgi:elongator complex protein 4